MITTRHSLTALSAAAHQRRIGLELQLIAAVLSDPSAGVRACRREGVTVDDFGEIDLRLMFAVCDAAMPLPRIDVLARLCDALEAEGHWNPECLASERR